MKPPRRFRVRPLVPQWVCSGEGFIFGGRSSAAAATSGETQGFTPQLRKAVNAYFVSSRLGCLFASVLQPLARLCSRSSHVALTGRAHML